MVNPRILKKQITFHPEILTELGTRLYKNPLDAFRELVVNAWDVDAAVVHIIIAGDRIEIEDDGSGVEDIDRFLSTGNPSKRALKYTPRLRRTVIGSKGIGKLSAFTFGDRVDVYSRNDDHNLGFSLTLRKESFEVPTTVFPDWRLALGHEGTRIVVKELRRTTDKDKVGNYLMNKIPLLLLDSNFRVLVNKKELKPAAYTGINVAIRTKYGPIRGIIAPTKKEGLIQCCCKGVIIKDACPDPARPVKGYVNADWLNLTADRDDFIADDRWHAFFSAITKWIGDNIPSMRAKMEQRMLRTIAKMVKILGRVAKRLGYLVEGAIPVSKGHKELHPPSMFKSAMDAEASLREPRRVARRRKKPRIRRPTYIKFHGKILKPERPVTTKPILTDYGITVDQLYLGKGRPPVFPQRPNYLILNLSNPITKEIWSRRGMYNQLLAWLLARGYALLLGHYDDIEEYLSMTDKLFSNMLNEMAKARTRQTLA